MNAGRTSNSQGEFEQRLSPIKKPSMQSAVSAKRKACPHPCFTGWWGAPSYAKAVPLNSCTMSMVSPTMSETIRVVGRSFSVTQLADGSGFCVTADNGKIDFDPPWSKRQAADYLQCSENTINRYMRKSDPLPHSKATGAPVFFRSEIDAWLRRNMVSSPAKGARNLI